MSMTRQRWLLLCIVGLFWYAQYVYVPYQTPYLVGIGTASEIVGIVVGAYGLTQFLIRMPLGVWVDRQGRHKGFILAGVLLAGLASLIRIALPDADGFLLANLLSGFASGMWISFMVLFATYFLREEMQKATGQIIAANNVGIFCAFSLSTMTYAHYGMSFLCLTAVLVSVIGIFLSLGIKEKPSTAEPLPVRELITVYKNKRLILFSLFALIQQGMMMSTSMSFTTEAARRIGASDWEIGMCSVIYIIAAVVSAILAASKTVTKRGAKFWLPVTFFATALYCVLTPQMTTPLGFYGIQAFSGLLVGILSSYCTSEALQEVPPDKRSTAMGYHQSLYAIGMTIMPVICGYFVRDMGLASAFYFLAVTALIGMAASIVYYKTKGAYAKAI